MSKYTVPRIKKISELISTGQYTIIEVCKQVGITRQTLYNWREEYPEFNKIIENAEIERINSIKEMALSGLAKSLNGYEYEEIITEDDKPVKKIKKYAMPNVTAIIFTLSNVMSDKFKRKDPESNAPQILPPLREIEDGCDDKSND